MKRCVPGWTAIKAMSSEMNRKEKDKTKAKPSDLQWLAYRYATGEMSNEEESSFELRLVEDQAAREAVAGAVQLHDALAAAGSDSMTVGVASRVWQRVAAAVAVVAAAAVCIVLAQPNAVTSDQQRPLSGPSQPIASVDQPQAGALGGGADQKLAELWATQWAGEPREVAAAAFVVEPVAPVAPIADADNAWDEPTVEEDNAAWMWEALNVTGGSDIDSSEGESL